MKKRVLINAKSYYNAIHKVKNNEPFSPGKSRVNYAGRVYGSEEIETLIDSSLEFYLTAGRYDNIFCEKISKYLQSENINKVNVLTVNSGSSANLIAISSLTSPKLGELCLKENDEVICVAAGFPTSISPIIQNKLIPVFIDVELGSYNIDTSKIEKSITSKTKAIMIAHTLGIPFDLDKILEIAEKYNLWVIEDNCDALGATYSLKREYSLINNKKVSGTAKTGTIGHIGTSSFYPAHQITMGEGGAVYTDSLEIYKIALSFRDWGRDCWCSPGRDNTCKSRFKWQLGLLPKGYDHKYTYSHIGYNLKITDMQAAIGVAQMDRVQGFAEKRYANWKYLNQKLETLKDFFILPIVSESAVPSPFGFALTIKDEKINSRDKIVEFLESCNIQTRTVFAGNILRQPALTQSDVKIKIESGEVKAANTLVEEDVKILANTDLVMKNTFWVGVYPGLSNEMLDYMIDKIIEATKK
ncbi:lipopolysaccharide biosynthesis protein RfbH [Halarcobacter anaerophilus]|uniref:Lipopolysaccharide biosynthesis protein RfbH n=2 Tax=Halarcobacter anaerophilus TaxID=877500 RepID=A0A4Q0XXF8_9BACT|nr:lipopolysaccharide biosynthesis protein RfbH [Halarcobacter anaerophilus]